MSSNYPPGSDTARAPWNQLPTRVTFNCKCGYEWTGLDDDYPADCEICGHIIVEEDLETWEP